MNLNDTLKNEMLMFECFPLEFAGISRYLQMQFKTFAKETVYVTGGKILHRLIVIKVQ